ncbi:hypothetical protein BX285_6397 [Streptomyces sp. 1114.5]|uniref:hypothetical protein n=1 Tax=Streptomyces sp. 1114.5 TaxID=1938830 RepID=UPI000EAC0CC1|nr:hypothetical protein [Streptomyces sp. 1114.5]RKT09311.1 hypothetical protein BX285_6397 [Streptomyces sp. 1114.5]
MPLFGSRKNVPKPLCDEHGPCKALAGISVFEVRDRLRLLVTPTRGLGPDPMARQIDDELSVVLCVNGGKRGGTTEALSIAEHAADQWSVSRAELWERAFANLATEQLNRQSFNATNGDVLYAVNGTGVWPGAAQALRLENALGGVELPHGALVTLPTSNAFCAAPIRSSSSLNAIRFMIDLSKQLQANDPAPLTSSIFWYRDGWLENLNVGDNGMMRPSARFRELANRLPAT